MIRVITIISSNNRISSFIVVVWISNFGPFVAVVFNFLLQDIRTDSFWILSLRHTIVNIFFYKTALFLYVLLRYFSR